MAETDDNSALLLRQDGLIYGPAGVQMRQKIRHGERRKNATIERQQQKQQTPEIQRASNPRVETLKQRALSV